MKVLLVQNNFYIDISDHYRQHNLEKQNVHQREVFLLERNKIFLITFIMTRKKIILKSISLC